MRAPIAVVLGLSVALCGACTASPGEEARPVDGFENTCPRGLTRPFSVRTLIDTAREHGISLERDPQCSAYTGDVDAATNVVDTTSEEYDEITRREGHVLCSLGDEPPPHPRPLRVRRTKYAGDEETHLTVGNVQCTIYPERPEHVERLHRALNAVARAPVERRRCPRRTPAPVGYETLVRAARSRGIELRRDERCIAPGVVAQASNVLVYLPYGSGDRDWDRIATEQGQVTCLLRARGGPAAIDEDKATVTTRFRYRNVECWITPLPDTNERQVDALRAVFEGLSRE